MPSSLVDRDPRVAPERLVAELVVPPRFAHTRFATYRPDAAQPSQAAAADRLQTYAGDLAVPERKGLFRRGRAEDRKRNGRGVYLDGGFGVGKTHLLASLWHGAPAPKVFASFVQLTALVGALGFGQTARDLSGQRLVCIDEFELDDPGDTVLISSLLTQLGDAGVGLAATSNTLPGALGEGRFAADDFLREIQGLAARFDVLRIDGDDYRHRGLPPAPAPADDRAVSAAAVAAAGATEDDFAHLLAHLARVHSSRYGALLDGVALVCLHGVAPIDDQAVALRLVAFADRLYDRDVPVMASGVAFDQMFTDELLGGGYRKKYLRTVSRLVWLSRR